MNTGPVEDPLTGVASTAACLHRTVELRQYVERSQSRGDSRSDACAFEWLDPLAPVQRDDRAFDDRGSADPDRPPHATARLRPSTAGLGVYRLDAAYPEQIEASAALILEHDPLGLSDGPQRPTLADWFIDDEADPVRRSTLPQFYPLPPEPGGVLLF